MPSLNMVRHQAVRTISHQEVQMMMVNKCTLGTRMQYWMRTAS